MLAKFYLLFCLNYVFETVWLDSDLIPRLFEIFENFKSFMSILLRVMNDAYRRILSAKAYFIAEISVFEILKFETLLLKSENGPLTFLITVSTGSVAIISKFITSCLCLGISHV